MPTEADLPGLILRLQWAAFGLGLALGAVAQRSHFCTMGALADVVTMGDWTRLRMWVLAVGVAVLGFNAMVALGWVRAADSVYAAPQLVWLSLPLGGLLFGAGMVLASGCGNKTLVRLGGGNLKSLVVLLVMGLSAWITLRGVTAVWRSRWLDTLRVDLPAGQDLPSLAAALWGGPVGTWAAGLGGVIGLSAVVWAAWPRRGDGQAPGHRAALGSAALVGGLAVGLWWVSGVWGHLAEHPVSLEAVFLATNSRRMESFSFVAPSAYLLEYLVFASDANRLLGLGVAAALGVVMGSALAAWQSGSFRWEGFTNTPDLARHLVGAVLMGVGGVTALGCTIGQGLSGLSTLAVGSALAVAGIVVGGVAMLRWQVWRLERSA